MRRCTAGGLLIWMLLFLSFGLCICGCNTAEGAARDVRQAGETTEHAINELAR